uniref:Uncharacterized protein n=1 Tax=Mycena chlorophos TaxID=658473 RepID=A0ABQ0L4D8_MYCCL|nr:predicted protein [Mycena chlorophos]
MLVLLPDLRYFNGALGKAIAGAILLKNRHSFPGKQNDAHEVFVAACDCHGSLAKNAIKTKVNAGIKKKIPIAQLVDELIHAFGPELNHTLELHHRVALIRMHVEQGHTPHSFWSKVDDELEELYNATPEEYVESLQFAYTEDKKKYPAKPSAKADTYPLGDGVGTNSKQWLQNLNAVAKKIKRGDTSTQSRAQKRKVGERDNTNDEEEGAAGGSGTGDVDEEEDEQEDEQQQAEGDAAQTKDSSSQAPLGNV